MAKPTSAQNLFGTFLGFGMQVVPSAYIVATGTVPTWARWTLGAFVGLWLLFTLIKASRAAA